MLPQPSREINDSAGAAAASLPLTNIERVERGSSLSGHSATPWRRFHIRCLDCLRPHPNRGITAINYSGQDTLRFNVTSVFVPWLCLKTTFALYLCGVLLLVTVNRMCAHADTHGFTARHSDCPIIEETCLSPAGYRPAHPINWNAWGNSQLVSHSDPEVSIQVSLSAPCDSPTREAATLSLLLSTVADDWLEKLRVPSQLCGCFIFSCRRNSTEGSGCHFFPFNVSRIPYVLQYLGYIYTWELPSITTALQCGPKRSSSSDALKESEVSEWESRVL